MNGEADPPRDRVLRFLAERSGRSAASILDEEPLTVFQLDSLDCVEFIMALEDEVPVESPHPDIPLRTMGDLVAFVRAILES